MNKMLSIATAVLLAFGLLPLHAHAADYVVPNAPSTPIQRSDAEIEALIDAMLSLGNYVDGEVIVCSIGSPTSDSHGLSAQSEEDSGDLLLGAETLSTVTAQQYSEATGAIVPLSHGQGEMRAQSAQDPVSITLVHRDDMSTAQLLDALLRDPHVLSAEPNYLLSFEEADQGATAGTTEPVLLRAASDDLAAASDGDHADLTSYQWFSEGVASTVPHYLDATNTGVHAPFWNTPGKTNADGVVVILDSGIDYTHPDLANVMYHFSPEQQAQLGCGEFGYAPSRDDPTDPMDGYGHGTHCAGVVAAEWNGFGVSGIASGVKLVPVCIAQSLSNSNFSYDAIIKGYDFIIRAAEAGVDIRAINRSIEKTPTNNANLAMMQAAGELGIVTVVASGNSDADIDTVYSDTAMYQSNPYVLRVDASSLQDDRAWFSNYGKATTDVFAPGVAILSTIPSVDPLRSRYFPQADDDPLFAETSFDGEFFDIDVDSIYRNTVNSVSQGDVSVDGDGKSFAVDTTVLLENGAGYYIDIPTGVLDKDNLQEISVALYAPGLSIGAIELCVLLENGYYTPASRTANTSMNAQRGWCFASLQLTPSTYMNQDIGYVTDSHGRTCIRLRVYGSFSKLNGHLKDPVNTTLYFDQISVGKKGNSGHLPYQYMDGTSMAAPCATGCTAIVSSLLQDANPADRAAHTVRMLKGSVRQNESYYGFCQQNGQIDLSLLDDPGKSVPVLESASISGKTLVLEGSNFGSSSGTLLVAGEEAQVVSWSDERIEAQWPIGVPSGLIPLAVKDHTGAEACRAFILEAPEPPADSMRLYERDLVPISLHGAAASIMDSPLSMVTNDDGTLFAAVPDVENSLFPAVHYVIKSDDKGASWNAFELPEELGHVSLAFGDGKVFVLGSTPPDDTFGIDTWSLFSVDAEQGTCTFLRDYDHYGTEINSIGSLAFVDGNLFMIDCYVEPDDYDSPQHMRIRRFAADYSLDDGQLLEHEYASKGSFSSVEIATTGTSIYVLGLDDMNSDTVQANTHGLERLDLNDDGTFTCTDLSSSISKLECNATDVAMAANDLGVFLVGNGLDPLLPEGAEHTDTFFLEKGGTSFEPYHRTLSFASVHTPACVCADRWLYAYGTSRFEEYAQFGRATKVIPEEYEIRFLNDDGTLLQTVTVKEGCLPAYTGDMPTKGSTAQYKYTFAGWDPEIAEAAADAEYRAVFDAALNAYEITYVLNGGTLDGKTGDVKATYDFGTVITLPTPAREGYTFSHWEGSRYDAGDSYTVEGTHTFTAIWEEEPAPEPEPEPEPEPGPGPEPTPGPEPEPDPEPTPSPTPDDPSQPSNGKGTPKTGDATNGLVPAASSLALLAGCVLVVAARRREERS